MVIYNTIMVIYNNITGKNISIDTIKKYVIIKNCKIKLNLGHFGYIEKLNIINSKINLFIYSTEYSIENITLFNSNLIVKSYFSWLSIYPHIKYKNSKVKGCIVCKKINKKSFYSYVES